MRPVPLLAMCAVALASAVPAQTGGDQSFLGIFAETKSTRIAGMKQRAMPHLPPGIKLPPAARAFMSGPTRGLTVRLWSPIIAPDNASASIVPPSGLQQGDKLDLQLFRPQPANAGAGGGGSTAPVPSQTGDLTIKIYWGSSETVQPGQPKVFTMSSLHPEQAMEIGKQLRSMMPAGVTGISSGNYFYKDGWTTAYWPTDSQPGEIADTASLPGTYTLNTNYAGNVSIDAPSNVDFLAPIEMASPDLSTKPNLANSLAFQWTAIPNVLGYYASMMGMEKDTNTIVLWSCSQNYGEQLMSDMSFLQMSEVNDMVQKNVFLPGSASSVTVPAAIFEKCEGAFLNMVGYGPGAAKDGVQPSPRIQTKTTLNVIFSNRAGRGG